MTSLIVYQFKLFINATGGVSRLFFVTIVTTRFWGFFEVGGLVITRLPRHQLTMLKFGYPDMFYSNVYCYPEIYIPECFEE